MNQILTVTLNPTVDLATSAERILPGRKLRCGRPATDPGGGGINVSRAIAILGGDSTAFIAVGGATGERLVQMLTVEGIGLSIFPGPGETRQSFSVTDRTTGDQYRFVLPGPEWTEPRVTLALDEIGKVVARSSYVVLSGSLPPGVPLEFPYRLAEVVARKGGRFVLDTSGTALRRVAELADPARGPVAHVLRMDHLEAEELAGAPLSSRKDSADFAQELVRRGLARIVILARGADGSTLVTAEERLHAEAAEVPVASGVGAGDSFVGAFTLSLSRAEPLATALSKGSAAASAAMMTEATKLCTRADAERLFSACPTISL
ncbi:1-phosphofructokinase family hexose kinase [Ostreiculturibacter nitratireducens]|uniref:1-phosphofructokinase family hexose kinase n=1 Tax=Ostreiculturibacter nitratireducens TaxID=3075226 RepID=UPI0031B5AAE8